MAIPFLNNINLDNNQLQNAKLHVTSSVPAAEAGQIYYNSTANEVRYYNGSSWISLVAVNSSITIGDSTIALGGTDTTLTGLTDIDLTAGNKTIFDGVGANTLTIGAGTTTIAIPGNLVVTGTTTTNHVETVSTTNGVIFEGNAADANELTLLAGTLTADRTVTLPDATGTVALTSNLLTTKTALIDVSSMGSNTTALIAHGINSHYLIVQLYDDTTGEVVFADIEYTSDGSTRSPNHVRVQFSSTPTNDIRVVIIDAKFGIGTIDPTYS